MPLGDDRPLRGLLAGNNANIYTIPHSVIMTADDSELQGQSCQRHLDNKSIKDPARRALDPYQSVANNHAFNYEA